MRKDTVARTSSIRLGRASELAKPDEGRIDPAKVAALYVEHGAELRRFVVGVLRDPDEAGDVLQATFVKAVELGHTARAETLKGWLFRVALHEALVRRRKRAVFARAIPGLVHGLRREVETADESLARTETVERVRAVLATLPVEQQQVVRMRMYEDKTFNQIAEELSLPLGTVLTRMRLAIRKMREKLGGLT